MIFDPNWPRWIISSVASHFKDCNENFFMEGFERGTDGKPEWVELRLDGPYIREMTKGCWKLEVEVNTLIVVNDNANAYRSQEIQGMVLKKFLDCLEVYQIGNQEPDDGELLGCLKLQQRGREKIIVTNFGMLKPDIRQFQSSIEGHYVMTLD